MNRVAIATILTALALTSTALAGTPNFTGVQLQHYDPAKATPSFAFPDLSGKIVKSDDLKGKVTMLVFWATW